MAASEASIDSRGPDPAEFEKAFVIEDESEEPSRVGTPALPDIMSDAPKPGAVRGDELNEKVGMEGDLEKDEHGSEATKPVELPPDVKTKLRKLEKLESRYQGTFTQNPPIECIVY